MADPDEGAQESDAEVAGGSEGAAPPSGMPSDEGGTADAADAPAAVVPDPDVPDVPEMPDLPDLEIGDRETVVPELEIPDADVPELEIPDADVPELDQAEPVIPAAVLPESFLAEPVIPPPPEDAPVTGADWRETWRDHSGPPEPSASGAGHIPEGAPPVTRAARRAASDPLGSPTAPASDPRLTAPEPDPAVVPPATGATSGGYRVLTTVIYAFLGVLLIGAVVTIGVLLA